MELFNKVYGAKTVVGDSGNVFPIPDIVESEIIWFARERSIILQYGRVIPMTSEKHSWPRETASATVAWGNTTSESEPVVDEVQLDAEELSCWAGIKNAHMADSRSDIVAWLTANLGEAAGLELDNKAFTGVGTDDPFICSGILSAACGTDVTLASTSTAFSQLGSTKLSEMIGALDGLRKQGARFFLHGSVLHFVRDLKDTNGRPIFMDGHIGAGVPGTIFGYPYTEVIKCPSSSASNTAFMAFGNAQYFFVGRRLDSATLDVDPYGLWTTNRTRYKIYQRWALEMGLPAAFVRLLTNSS
jgi:HK97 family phage major capsid protein